MEAGLCVWSCVHVQTDRIWWVFVPKTKMISVFVLPIAMSSHNLHCFNVLSIMSLLFVYSQHRFSLTGALIANHYVSINDKIETMKYVICKVFHSAASCGAKCKWFSRCQLPECRMQIDCAQKFLQRGESLCLILFFLLLSLFLSFFFLGER